MYKIILICLSLLCCRHLSAQNVGIGTKTPVALLHVKDGSVLFSGLNYFTGNPAKPPVKGKGTRTFWYAEKAAFRTGGVYNSSLFGFPDQDTSNFHNWDRDSIGVCSFASGFNTKAKGDFSFAVGEASYATGTAASSFGSGNNAQGNFCLAAGFKSRAVGEASTAFGYYANAEGKFSLAAGEFTSATGDNAVSLGSATMASGKHAVAVGFSTISSGDYSTTAGDNTKASGDFSTAIGEYALASADYSMAFGTSTKAQGYGSLAMGNSTLASGVKATAFGETTIASGDYSTATGKGNSAIGYAAFVTGSGSSASGAFSTAMGMQTTAGGDRSVAMGDNNSAAGNYSTALGSATVASGAYATAIGKSNKATGYAAFAGGVNTTASGVNSTSLGVNANTNAHVNSFCIGGSNTSTANSTDNQMMMRFDNYTFWVSASNYAYLIPASNGWAYTSDRNKKEKFLELNGETVLNKISTIPFYSWNFKANDTKQYRHYGIMAQDFYNAFGKDDFGVIGNDTTVSPLDMLGVAYSAIKELEKRTGLLQNDNKRLTDEVNSLKGMLTEMDKLKLSLEAIKQKLK